MTAGRRLARAYVNNGGDIALHLGPGETFSIGMVDRPDRPSLIGRAAIGAADHVRGVATSGWRGRSFSLGVADAVTVLAASAALADAAATLIANAVDHSGPSGDRARAGLRPRPPKRSRRAARHRRRRAADAWRNRSRASRPARRRLSFGAARPHRSGRAAARRTDASCRRRPALVPVRRRRGLTPQRREGAPCRRLSFASASRWSRRSSTKAAPSRNLPIAARRSSLSSRTPSPAAMSRRSSASPTTLKPLGLDMAEALIAALGGDRQGDPGLRQGRDRRRGGRDRAWRAVARARRLCDARGARRRDGDRAVGEEGRGARRASRRADHPYQCFLRAQPFRRDRGRRRRRAARRRNLLALGDDDWPTRARSRRRPGGTKSRDWMG